ncbi:MAG: hypothetical protein OIN66_15190 [Candidatus Methanoperedens sp.]|nr:hypothetical protein [Candidatus Methanoperedens sp.]
MSFADEFIKYCTQTLEVSFGQRSNTIIDKVLSKKNLNEASNAADFKEFIDLIEHEIGALLGEDKAMNMCKSLQKKAIELNISKQITYICNSLRTEPFELNISVASGTDNALNISTYITKPSLGQKYRSIAFGLSNKLLKRYRSMINLQNTPPSESTKLLEKPEKQKSHEFYISSKIDEFLMKNTLPAENEITRYATFLALKYGSDAKKVKKIIIEKAKVHVKNEISRKAIRKEIHNFLLRYPQPTQRDMDEFVNYINLLKQNLHSSSEIQQLIEKERLCLRFSESQAMKETPELDQFINIIQTNNDKRKIIEAMQKKELSSHFPHPLI